MTETLPSLINWQFSIGNILEILMIGAGLITLVNKLQSQITLLRKDLSYIQKSQEALSEAFKQLGTILTQVAVQDTRLSMIEKRVDELAHGEGLISSKK